MSGKSGSGYKEWVARTGGNRLGTRFFESLISVFGLYPAYAMLFFAAAQYLLFDRKGADALRDFRRHLGLATNFADLYGHFYSFGTTLIDRYAFATSRRTGFYNVHINEDLIRRELGRGKGVILLGAHIGNWELAGRLLTKRLNVRAHVFMYDDGTATPVEVADTDQGLSVHHVQESASDTAVEIINALRRSEIVCLHGDRFFGQQRTETIDFFGAPAVFPAGPMAIAAITGASVLPCFTVRTRLLRYEFYAAQPIYVGPCNREERDVEIRSAIKRYVSALEDVCRKYPGQWYNFYRFWKS